MTPGQSVSTCLSKYADFRGRAGRSELWWFLLFAVVLSWSASIVDAVLFAGWTVGEITISGPLSAVTNLLLLLPFLAVGARRLHDTHRTGWWLVLLLIPCVGLLLLAVFWSLPSKVRGDVAS